MTSPLKPESFRDLVNSGAVKSTTILGRKGGYAVLAGVGQEQLVLGTRQGTVRMFSTADTAIKWLRGVGVYHAQLDATHFEEGSLRPSRPDTVRKSREANAALAHDRWFREQVQSTLDSMARGEEGLVAHDEAWGDLEAYAVELTAQRHADKAKAPISRRKPG